MADNNRNRGDQYYGGNQDWQDNRNRMNRNRDFEQYSENEESFGNAGYNGDADRGNDLNRMGYGEQQRRVNYIPDNDDNRPDYQSGGQSGWRSVNNISGGYDINDNDRNWQGNRQAPYENYSSRRHDVNYGGNEANDWNNDVRNKDDRGWWNRERRDVSSWMSENDNFRESRGNRDYPTTTGVHRGKGPRGCQRSDERIREDVCDRFSDDAMLDASDIEVEVNGSEVVLTGTVLSREAKRHAEDLAESISGVRNVENRIRVGRVDEIDGNYTMRQIIRATGNEEATKENRRNKR